MQEILGTLGISETTLIVISIIIFILNDMEYCLANSYYLEIKK